MIDNITKIVLGGANNPTLFGIKIGQLLREENYEEIKFVISFLSEKNGFVDKVFDFILLALLNFYGVYHVLNYEDYFSVVFKKISIDQNGEQEKAYLETLWNQSGFAKMSAYDD